jgi:hypothetical protein
VFVCDHLLSLHDNKLIIYLSSGRGIDPVLLRKMAVSQTHVRHNRIGNKSPKSGALSSPNSVSSIESMGGVEDSSQHTPENGFENSQLNQWSSLAAGDGVSSAVSTPVNNMLKVAQALNRKKN